MSALPPSDLPHLLHEALSQLGWSADPQQLSAKLALLHRGLPNEDAFAVVCTWLGRCKIIHKLDQSQLPSCSTEQYQVPDLIACFDYKGRVVPVLIEVKSSTDQTLSFRPDYRDRLLAYANALGLPMLIAWKHHSMWSLFEIERMRIAKKNFNVTLGEAVSNSLLGVLAGDFSYTLPKGTGLHLRMRKMKLVSSETTEDGKQEGWHTVVEDVYHSDREGSERRDLAVDVQALFFAHDLRETLEATDTHVHLHFTVEEDSSKFAHMALAALLNWYLGTGEVLNWREVASRRTPVPGMPNFQETVERAMREKLVQYVLHVHPQNMPAFLGAA